jgi:Ras-related GTP-binding protein A/B
MKNIIHLNSDNIEKSFTKILLMGNKGSGKTSIKSIIFQQKLPKDTIKLAPTNEIEEIHVKIMGNININLIDCCSKDEYNNKYFNSKKDKIFSKVDILIFVINAFEFINASNSERKKSLDYFQK